MKGRAALTRLIDQLTAGCESELELWGYLEVFDAPGLRRDAALASIGWLTLRYSHERLHRDVAGCRRDTLAALAARSAWRRSGIRGPGRGAQVARVWRRSGCSGGCPDRSRRLPTSARQAAAAG